MIHDQILEGNKLIVEFLGIRKNVHNQDQYLSSSFPDNIVCEVHELKYHSSWDWLMPVVEKMEKMGYCMDINPWEIWVIEYVSGDESSIISYDIDSELTKIENWYFVVVKFIKWYNTQKVIN